MQAFNGSEEFKNELLALDKEHQRLDMYVKQSYGERDNQDFRGCSVGCLIYSLSDTAETDNHAYLAERLGVPEFVVHLQDSIFEGLKDSSKWTEQLLKAIPVGADLNPVLPRFLKFVVEMNPSEELYHKMTVGVLDNWIETGSPDFEKANCAFMESSCAGSNASISAANEASISAASLKESEELDEFSNVSSDISADRALFFAVRARQLAENKSGGDIFNGWSEAWDQIAAEFLRLIKECK